MRKHWRFLTIIATLLAIGLFIVVAETQVTQITQSVGLGLLGGSNPASSPTYRWKDVAGAGANTTTGIGAVGLYVWSPAPDNFWERAPFSPTTGLLVDVYQIRRFPQSQTVAGANYFVLLNAAAAVVAGPTTTIVTANGTTSFFASKHTWEIIVTGAPTNVTVNFEAMGESGNWYILDTSNITTSEMRHVVNKLVRNVRANLTQLVGGTAPTVTVYSIHGGN